jgi:hypothetical protein
MPTLEYIWDARPPTYDNGEAVEPDVRKQIIHDFRQMGFRDFRALRGPAWRVEEAEVIRSRLVFRRFQIIGKPHHWLTPKPGGEWYVRTGSREPADLQQRVIDALYGEARSSFFYYHWSRAMLDEEDLVGPLLRNDRAVWITHNPQYDVYQNEDGDNFRGKSAKEAETMYQLSRP